MQNLTLNLNNDHTIHDWLKILAHFKVASLKQLQAVAQLNNINIEQLEQNRVLVRQDIPTIDGEMKTILALGRAGAEEIVRQTGQELSDIPYFTPARFKRSMFTIEHELGITKVGLCLEKLSRTKKDFKLLHWETSPQRIGTSVRIRTSKGLEVVPLVADAFWGVGVKGKTQWILLEYDRGTIDLKRMRKKLTGYLEWWKCQGATNRFGVKNLRVLYLVPNEKRLKALLQIWKELTVNGGKGFIWFGLHDVVDLAQPEKLMKSHFNRMDAISTVALFT